MTEPSHPPSSPQRSTRSPGRGRGHFGGGGYDESGIRAASIPTASAGVDAATGASMSPYVTSGSEDFAQAMREIPTQPKRLLLKPGQRSVTAPVSYAFAAMFSNAKFWLLFSLAAIAASSLCAVLEDSSSGAVATLGLLLGLAIDVVLLVVLTVAAMRQIAFDNGTGDKPGWSSLLWEKTPWVGVLLLSIINAIIMALVSFVVTAVLGVGLVALFFGPLVIVGILVIVPLVLSILLLVDIGLSYGVFAMVDGAMYGRPLGIGQALKYGFSVMRGNVGFSLGAGLLLTLTLFGVSITIIGVVLVPGLVMLGFAHLYHQAAATGRAPTSTKIVAAQS